MARTLRNLRIADASGRKIMGTPWRGYLGSEIPVGSAIYNDLSLPADANNDYVLKIQTWPSQGTLFLKEDGSPIYTPAGDGTFTAVGKLYQNGTYVAPDETITFITGPTGAIIASIGSNTSAGLPATILAARVIAASIGGNVATGLPATIVRGAGAGVVIQALVGGCVSSGVAATVLASGILIYIPESRSCVFSSATNKALYSGATNKAIF